jgi:hypothetical protein
MEPEVRSWMMAALTAVFVILYVLALVGKLPDANEDALGHVAPIVAVIIGYYFGRVPAEKHQKDLKEQIEREATKAKEEEKKAAAAKEAQTRETVERRAAEEKIAAARAALSSAESPPDAARAAFPSMRAADAASQDALRHGVAAALKILGSAVAAEVETISFEVRWLGGMSAKLLSLIDNEGAVEQYPEGPSPLTVRYPARRALTHTIEWDVWAPGQEMKKLTAKARREGGEIQELDSAEKAEDRWASQGVLE